jgi:hypothetical protein
MKHKRASLVLLLTFFLMTQIVNAEEVSKQDINNVNVENENKKVESNLNPLPLEQNPLQSSLQNRRSSFVRFFTDAEWYFSWGYNREFWSPSDIHVSQPSEGNDFTMHNVKGNDEPVNPLALFKGDFFGPQYNIRIGRFINQDRTIAVELSIDHTKYATVPNQSVLVTGRINGVPVHRIQQLTPDFFSQQLHNGANHIMLNAVYRLPLIGKTNETLSLAGIFKGGAGIMLPHTSNTIMGNPNNVGSKTLGNAIGFTNGWWQLNGWTAGVEIGVRFVIYKPFYLELTDKQAYSYLGNLPAYRGTVQQSLWMNEVILSLGFTYDGTAK